MGIWPVLGCFPSQLRNYIPMFSLLHRDMLCSPLWIHLNATNFLKHHKVVPKSLRGSEALLCTQRRQGEDEEQSSQWIRGGKFWLTGSNPNFSFSLLIFGMITEKTLPYASSTEEKCYPAIPGHNESSWRHTFGKEQAESVNAGHIFIQH